MGGSTFFFIEAKYFEFSVVENKQHSCCISMRGRDSFWSIFIGKESTKWVLTKNNHGQFVRSICEGKKVFIIQRYLNAKGLFLMTTKLLIGWRKESIIVLEGRKGSG